jgi:hypothetical protein
MDAVSNRIRGLLIALIIARASFSWWIISATILGHMDQHGTLGLSNEYTLALMGLEITHLVTWIIYVSCYTLTAVLVYLGKALSVPVVIVAVALDIGLWILTTSDPEIFHISQVAGASWAGIRDLAFNLAAVLTVGGVLMLKQRGVLSR